jgi:SAM-dependent methyltransferase
MNLHGGGNRGKTRTQAEEYNELARNVFFPAYPVIAHQILKKADIDTGWCLDAGCGPGHLAIAIASLTDLMVFAMDNSRPMCQLAGENIRKYRMEERVKTSFGEPGAIPFESGSMDLVVSRESFFFWESLSRGFAECMRILRPGGMAYIGHGFGSAGIRNEVYRQMKERDPGWKEQQRRRNARCTPHIIRSALAAAGIFEYDLVENDTGCWVIFTRP